jgi:hypothetical protein
LSRFRRAFVKVLLIVAVITAVQVTASAKTGEEVCVLYKLVQRNGDPMGPPLTDSAINRVGQMPGVADMHFCAG